MDDLISRKTALDEIGKTADELYENIKRGATFPQRQWFDGMAHAQSILEALPSAQPEIIRCKDCKWCVDADELMCKNTASWVVATDSDFGCVYAERRTND